MFSPRKNSLNKTEEAEEEINNTLGSIVTTGELACKTLARHAFECILFKV
jgi:hypothetical protein